MENFAHFGGLDIGTMEPHFCFSLGIHLNITPYITKSRKVDVLILLRYDSIKSKVTETIAFQTVFLVMLWAFIAQAVPRKVVTDQY